MAKKRHHSSSVNHHADHFNDEVRHQKDKGARGMFRRPESHAELYAGMDASKRRQLEDSQMIHENPRAIANLPQEVMIKPYPMAGSYMREMLNDDVSGVDAQINFDDSQRRAHFYPKKV